MTAPIWSSIALIIAAMIWRSHFRSGKRSLYFSGACIGWCGALNAR